MKYVIDEESWLKINKLKDVYGYFDCDIYFLIGIDQIYFFKHMTNSSELSYADAVRLRLTLELDVVESINVTTIYDCFDILT